MCVRLRVMVWISGTGAPGVAWMPGRKVERDIDTMPLLLRAHESHGCGPLQGGELFAWQTPGLAIRPPRVALFSPFRISRYARICAWP